MDLRQLSGAVAVARYSNFTRAAASLHIAQPALSAQIRNLEHEVGIPLFERTTRRVVVTPAGLAFIAHADRILAEVDAASREMAEYAGGVLGRVRIGAWYTVNPQLPALLAGFVKTHPNVEITIREENSDVMLDMVRAGELDVALPIMCKGLDLTDIDHLVYLEEPFLLAVAPNSPLASRASVAVEELFDTPMITLKPGSAIRYLIEQAFLAAGGSLRVAVETTETSAARAFVSAGIGAALIPQSVAELPGPPVTLVALSNPPVRASALAWSRGRRTAASRAFIAYARTRFARGAARSAAERIGFRTVDWG